VGAFLGLVGALFSGNVLEFIYMFTHTPQYEYRSISENYIWGIRRKYEQGKVSVNCTKFLGHDKGSNILQESFKNKESQVGMVNPNGMKAP